MVPIGARTQAQSAADAIALVASQIEIAAWIRKQLKAVNSICSVCESRASNFIENVFYEVAPALKCFREAGN